MKFPPVDGQGMVQSSKLGLAPDVLSQGRIHMLVTTVTQMGPVGEAKVEVHAREVGVLQQIIQSSNFNQVGLLMGRNVVHDNDIGVVSGQLHCQTSARVQIFRIQLGCFAAKQT